MIFQVNELKDIKKITQFEPIISMNCVQNQIEKILEYKEKLENILEKKCEKKINIENKTFEEIYSYLNYTNEEKEKNNMLFLMGGLFNHIFFFSIIKEPSFKSVVTKEDPNNFFGYNENEKLLEMISLEFGSIYNLKKEILKITNKEIELGKVGWVWLTINTKEKKLFVKFTEKNDTIFFTEKIFPIFVIDVWEHSYTDYNTNNKGLKEYLEKIFEYLLDWEKMNESFLQSLS